MITVQAQLAFDEQVVRAARYLDGAPFVHQGRAGRDGVDCAGVLVCTGDAVEAKIADETNYSRTDSSKLYPCIAAACKRVDLAELVPGRIALFRLGRKVWHCGVVTEIDPVVRMVHAWMRTTSSTVREEEVSKEWLRRLHSVWKYEPTKEWRLY